MMVTFAFPLYFKNVICSGDASGDALWGVSVSLSMLLVALVSPVLGAIADAGGQRYRLLLLFTVASVVATGALAWSGPGMAFGSALLFLVANSGFEGGLVFYDAYLKELVPDRVVGKVSGAGFAAGYLGAFSILLLVSPLLAPGIDVENMAGVQQSFVVASLFFAIFSLPLFVMFRPGAQLPPADGDGRDGMARGWSPGLFLQSLRQVRETISHIGRYPDLGRFLLAFFFYNDAILTVIAFSSIYAQNSLGFSSGDLIRFFMLVQTTAIVGSVVFGWLTDVIGAKRTIMVTLLIWFGVVLAAVVVQSRDGFFVTGMVAGLAMGSAQAASRAMMTRLTPPEHVTEFFGFYDGTFGKASAIVGPLVFGLVSSLTGSQQMALASLLIFFTTGLVLMARVRFSGDRRGVHR